MAAVNDRKLHCMAAVKDRKMHSMACALGRAEHAENRERLGSATTKTDSNFTKIPSNQHFKAFPMSKFNSETSFLYQLLEGNSKIILLQPCKVILYAYFLFFFLSFCIYLYIHLNKVTF